MDDIAISVRNVSKRYGVFANNPKRLMNTLWPKRYPVDQEVWALHDVSFDVKRGDSVSVIGRNGGGKSTLLQIITGVVAPTSGEVRVKGRVSALLELGSGFNPEYTGRDNVILGGLLLGLQRHQILERFAEIATFADLGDAIERPVKTYSSGMLMRLAFAVQVLTDPEILIIDEALSVGDFFFQQKCFGYIRSLRERGVTLLFVSHDMGTVRDMCTTGLLLKSGHVDYFGDNLQAIRRYMKPDEDAPAADPRPDAAIAPPAVGVFSREPLLALDQPLWIVNEQVQVPASSKKGQLLAVGVYTAAGQPTLHTKIGVDLMFRVLFRADCREPLHISVVIKNKYDQIITAMGSHVLRTSPPALKEGEQAIFELTLRPDLEAGLYSFVVRLAQPAEIGAAVPLIDESPWLGPLQVAWDYHREIPPFYGMVGLNASARFVVSPQQVAE